MDKKHILLVSSLILVLMLSACTTYEYNANETDSLTGNVIGDGANISPGGDLLAPVEDNKSGEEKKEETNSAKPDVIAYEGDLIDLKPLVMDPDGDSITLGFTLPFDEKGIWQTKEGDSGFYSVIITATDNKDSFVTKQMTIKVLIRNKPPVIEIADTLDFNEGDMIVLNPQITDPENATVFVTYSGWMNSKMYQTTYGDAGEHKETITANDGIDKVTKELTISVKDVNRVPEIIFEGEPSITVTEEDLVSVGVKANDPDGETVTLSFSKPLSESGKWQTKRGDAGKYKAKIIASDGVNEVTKEIEITVLKKNEAPVIESVTIEPVEVILKKPGDTVTVKIKVEVKDPDGDNVELTYSGYMDSDKKTINYGEKGGLKTVTVTASDGKESVSKDVSFNMNNWPCFDCQN
jgi:hypothetical protein